MRVDTEIHPQPEVATKYIRKGTFVEVGKGISPNFEQVLDLLLNKEEFLGFAPDTEETRSMINIISVKFPLLKFQQVLDSFIIFAAQQSDTKNIELPSSLPSGEPSSLKVPWTSYGPSNIRIVPFPTHEYTDDEFQSIIKSVMGEQKIREGLYTMGLEDGILHLSWFIAYNLQFAVSSAIITVCTMDNHFKYSDKTVVFIHFFFGLSAIMLSFLITTFFTRAKTAVAVGTL
ncbi:hypothetical protein ACE6H2_023157 [Prunus campanulata]